jgi:hypothetical protein
MIYLLPREKPYLAYIYIPKMDVDQLVYNLGGIMGMWFGISVYALLMKMFSFASKINKENIKSILILVYNILIRPSQNEMKFQRKIFFRRELGQRLQNNINQIGISCPKIKSSRRKHILNWPHSFRYYVKKY